MPSMSGIDCTEVSVFGADQPIRITDAGHPWGSSWDVVECAVYEETTEGALQDLQAAVSRARGEPAVARERARARCVPSL